MLQSLHVKNLALIRETEIQFGEGLNILTGETGAGKSILIGSINLALGGKFDKDMLRKEADYALVELIFRSADSLVQEKMQQLDLASEEDGTIIISRRMQPGRSVLRINGETVTARQVKELAELLIDIHGQHEHQSLLHKKKHMEILDAFCGEEITDLLTETERLYKESRRIAQLLQDEALDEEAKRRQQALAQFESEEIAAAGLHEGEDEELEQRYKKMLNSRKITENLAESYQYTSMDSQEGAAGALSRALKNLGSITAYDPELEKLETQLLEIDGLLADYNRDVAEYLEDCEFDEEDYRQTEERLNQINHLKGKYGRTIEDILDYEKKARQQLKKLEDYDDYMEGLKKDLQKTQEKLSEVCEKLSGVRKKHAADLTVLLEEALIHLNFLSVEFEIAVRPGQAVSPSGWDEVEFLISTNPGESLKPLGQVASGGELSRIMLAIKTVLAHKDAIDTLIFDEIDTGISGRTAWRVSEQLHYASQAHQVICITHLPQIAAMADKHFVIEKSSAEGTTVTQIHETGDEESLKELARLLGSDELTQAALINAGEMRSQAEHYKQRTGSRLPCEES